jgi:hypothetical protein
MKQLSSNFKRAYLPTKNHYIQQSSPSFSREKQHLKEKDKLKHFTFSVPAFQRLTWKRTKEKSKSKKVKKVKIQISIKTELGK